MNAEPCALHDLSNCATCSGAARQHERSLVDERPDGRPDPIPGGVTIWAEFHGTCGRCSGRIFPGDPIWREYGSFLDEGWVGVECCLRPSDA